MSDNQRVAVITGASSGIGKEAAKQLVSQGWFVIAHGRTPSRSDIAQKEIAAEAANGGRVEFVNADLCSLKESEGLAAKIATLTGRVDILIENAGGVRNALEVTKEGNEVTFSGNHLGHFLLTGRLLPLLRNAASRSPAGHVRIVNVSSAAHQIIPAVDWNNIQNLENWNSIGAYGVAKLANIWFARELDRRFSAEGIAGHAYHPGQVDSNFASHGTEDLQAHMAAANTISPAQAAAKLVWVATAPEVGAENFQYWVEGVATPPSILAQDNEAALKFWGVSEELVAKSGYQPAFA